MRVPVSLRSALAILPPALLGGCGLAHAPVLDPHGGVALTERNLMLIATGAMLFVIVPVFLMTVWYSWRYRASNPGGPYEPEWTQSARLEVLIWCGPAVIVALIAYLVWDYTHRLDPYRPIASAAAALEVEAVAEDWKWIFIYPAQNIAAVNELVFPAGKPLRLELTSDTAMNSFYVPGLGGQIFAMAGMRTKLNLNAASPSQFTGRNVQFTGDGFPKQEFAVRAVKTADFDAWLAAAKQSPDALNDTSLAVLEKPGSSKQHYYSSVEPDLFAHIVAKYAGPPGLPHEPGMHASASSEGF